jgi:GntR family transcriptional regulator
LNLKILLYLCTIILLQYNTSTMINFNLDPKTGAPYYRQIIDQIRFGIAKGDLKIGEQLPTVRALAVELKVNLNTVAKAYKELEIQNVLETQQGTGTFISKDEVQLTEKEKDKKLEDICNEFSTIAFSYGFTINDIIIHLQKQS